MSLIPTSVSVGSVSSVRSTIGDALNSYRRVQHLIAESPIVSLDDVLDPDSDVEEGEFRRIHDAPNEGALSDDNDDSFVGQLLWDEDIDNPVLSRNHAIPREKTTRRASLSLERSERYEGTPLLQAVSSSSCSPASFTSPGQEILTTDRAYHTMRPRRRPSAISSHSVHNFRGGQSTFGQSLFNTTTILLGIGVLSEPLAFAYTGWIMGTILLISYAFVSCYTAKILARFIFSDARLKTYTDIGRMAFGPRSHIIMSTFFCLELFATGVILVTLYGDSLHVLFPQYPANTYKAIGAVILIPTVFLPLTLLSYTSIMGIISSTLLVMVVFIDGFTKREAPGSLWDPASTSFELQGLKKLGIGFGLFMAGFSGHAVIPSLAQDMSDPSQFDTMVNWAFAIATLIYAAIGYAGYLMFGNDVSDEISKDLLSTIGYNPILNEAALWVMAINPISKFALSIYPIYATLDVILGSSDGRMKMKGSNSGQTSLGNVFRRVLLTIIVVGVAILFPQFGVVMAFVGSFSSFMVNIIFPLACKVAVQGRCNILDGTIIVVSLVMAVWGTLTVFVFG